MNPLRILYLTGLLMAATQTSKADDPFQTSLFGDVSVPGKDTTFDNVQSNNLAFSDSGSSNNNGTVYNGSAAIYNRSLVVNGQLQFDFSGNHRGSGGCDGGIHFVLKTPMYCSFGGSGTLSESGPGKYSFIELYNSANTIKASFGVFPGVTMADGTFQNVIPAGNYTCGGVCNNGGSGFYSGWLKITPFPLPYVTTGSPTFGIGAPTVTLNGSVNPNGQAVDALFLVWRERDHILPPYSVHLDPSDGTTTQAVSSQPITNLSPGTRYYCSLIAQIRNSDAYIDGNVVEFVTPSSGSVIQFTSDNYSVSRSEYAANITVECLGGSTQPLTGVSWTVSDGTAHAETDYRDYYSSVHTLSWAIGDNQPKTFPVTILPLATAPPRTVILTLNSPTGGATLGTRTKATLTISDDGAAAPPPFAIGSVTFLPSGGVHLQCVGKQNTACQIESSSDLNSGFSPLGTVFSDASGAFHYNDYTNASQKFYRLRLAP